MINFQINFFLIEKRFDVTQLDTKLDNVEIVYKSKNRFSWLKYEIYRRKFFCKKSKFSGKPGGSNNCIKKRQKSRNPTKSQSYVSG